MRVLFYFASALVALAAAFVYTASSSDPLPASILVTRSPSVANGEYIFNAAGCGNCHATEGQKSHLRLGGGHSLRSPFGTFIVPNISSSPRSGIGSWSEIEFVNAVLRGIGRDRSHLFPSFPFTSYQRMTLDDVRDLYQFLLSLPADDRASEPHRLGFPFNIRLGVGIWKRLYFRGGQLFRDNGGGSELKRGAYLVEGLAHCAECHSERNWLGAILPSRRFAGGTEPGGKSWVPNITPHADGLPDWSLKDFEFFLETGFTPAGIAAGSSMAEVIKSTSKLTVDDRRAMAVYLKSLPPRPGKRP
jgi:mono/diheme cytochrome c family protein